MHNKLHNMHTQRMRRSIFGSWNFLLVLITVHVVVFGMTMRFVPEPYMDEIFHVPQAQSICNNNFTSWDPKITTPPGLYYISYLLKFLFGCELKILRATNILFSVGIFFILLSILRILQQRDYMLEDDVGCRWRAFCLCSFPLHFFYAFIYYTDVGSVFFLLLGYLLLLKQRLFLSSLICAVSVLFRQTNVVWTLCLLGLSVLDDYSTAREKRRAECNDDKHYTFDVARFVFSRIHIYFKRFVFHLILFISFGIFVIWNGSLVLGDKEHHVASPHFAQLLYLFFCVGVCIIAEVRWNVFLLSLRWLFSLEGIFASTFCAFVVRNYSFTHPFLLADNRHYTFYIWKRWFLAYPYAKYVLVPFYSFFFRLVSLWMERRKCDIFVQKLRFIGLVISSVIVICPAPLVEPRYFTIPFLLIYAHGPFPSRNRQVLTLSIFMAVNVVTLIMFHFWTFREADGSIGRFMW